MEHSFTDVILNVLENKFGEKAKLIFGLSDLLKYINEKTKSANRGSKARGSFASLYAVYVLVEDYIEKGFAGKGDYSKYEGANFSNLLKRQRELPFGAKLQNHSLNNRVNSEFEKICSTCEFVPPILRNTESTKYWFNENLLKISIEEQTYNIAESVIEIINKYIQIKQNTFIDFIKTCEELKGISNRNAYEIKTFIYGLLKPKVDARIFEIVSYAILKYVYIGQKVFFGYSIDKLNEETLKLYKTGRTNANDGGIDFVMKPLGRFFQVTETLDIKKYFLDIDKVEKYPITFVVKTELETDTVLKSFYENAKKQYSIDSIIKNYMDCIEEIINIPELKKQLEKAINNNYLNNILDEIILQSKVEFNDDEDEEEEDE